MSELADNVRTYLQTVNLAVIATSNRDGSPHQTTLWYELRGDDIVMNTTTASKKIRNLRRRPWASVCVYEVSPSRHVTVEGPVEFDDSQVLEDLTALASRYAGAEAGPGIAANIAKVPHITVRLKIEKVRTFGKI
jgi:PPOX class probable F420-dependent enzyme